MDLTNSLTQNQGNVVGIVRAELMLAKYLHKIDSSIRFSVLTDYGFREVEKSELKCLFKSENINDDYVKYQKRKHGVLNSFLAKIGKKLDWEIFRFKRHYIKSHKIPKDCYIIYPYHDNDIVFSCGWINTNKENLYSKVLQQVQNLRLIYTIYDICLIKDEMNYLYYPYNMQFYGFLNWVSQNCSAIIYGGKTAQKDTENYFRENNFPILPGHPVKWGNDISPASKKSDVLERLNIKLPYILSVGSVDFKKNYKVLYRAYCMMKQKNVKDIPQLVIVGRFVGLDPEFESMLQENPLIKDSIKIISCSDEDLNELYKNCLFTVLPTLYEGWSLTLPESLYYGKLCICSDVEPLREVGKNFACYLNPQHPKEWADKIEYFINNKEKIKEFEDNIRKNWKSVSWEDAAKNIYNCLVNPNKTDDNQKPVLYYDIGLLKYDGALTGITRTQMLLARYLYEYNKNMKFFMIQSGQYTEFSVNELSHLLSDQDLDVAWNTDKQAKGFTIKNTLPFKKQDIVFSAGAGYDDKSFDVLTKLHNEENFMYCHTIYDFTPIVVPHVQNTETVKIHPRLLNNIYNLSDFIFYGGKTAQKDGLKYQTEKGMSIKNSVAIKWGSNIVSHEYTDERRQQVLQYYGITGDYILSVGTIEARKNHEILYRAYLELLSDESLKDNLPQFVICGHPGWKTEGFRRAVSFDNRVRGKFIMITPTDEELDILYQNCKFTCLPSFYEGWSLTLPESLNYGKFCLASDTPSLKETGENIIDYANPYDPVEWADKIKFYYINKDALQQKEEAIKKKWHNTTWRECAEKIDKVLKDFMEK